MQLWLSDFVICCNSLLVAWQVNLIVKGTILKEVLRNFRLIIKTWYRMYIKGNSFDLHHKIVASWGIAVWRQWCSNMAALSNCIILFMQWKFITIFLYTDKGSFSFTSIIFYGNEWSLFLFDVLLFAIVDLVGQNYVLAAIVTYIIGWVSMQCYIIYWCVHFRDYDTWGIILGKEIWVERH